MSLYCSSKMLIFISDKKLSSFGLKYSRLFLSGREKPTIVLAVIDLVKNDPEWSNVNFTIGTLLQNSIVSHPEFREKFHPNFKQNGEIVKNLQDYYSWVNLDPAEFTENEDLILQMLSLYLKRRIKFSPILKPIYSTQFEISFGENFEISYSIFGYRNHIKSFYIKV